jgi:hypothetical protein
MAESSAQRSIRMTHPMGVATSDPTPLLVAATAALLGVDLFVGAGVQAEPGRHVREHRLDHSGAGGCRRGHAAVQQSDSTKTAAAAMAVSPTRRAITCTRSALINDHGRAPYSPVASPDWPTLGRPSPSDVSGFSGGFSAQHLRSVAPVSDLHRDARPPAREVEGGQGQHASVTVSKMYEGQWSPLFSHTEWLAVQRLLRSPERKTSQSWPSQASAVVDCPLWALCGNLGGGLPGPRVRSISAAPRAVSELPKPTSTRCRTDHARLSRPVGGDRHPALR